MLKLTPTDIQNRYGSWIAEGRYMWIKIRTSICRKDTQIRSCPRVGRNTLLLIEVLVEDEYAICKTPKIRIKVPTKKSYDKGREDFQEKANNTTRKAKSTKAIL